MLAIIVRDDDINYFTPVWALERVYGKCWNAGIPVSFSVIPNVLTQNRYKHEYNPFVPESFTGVLGKYPIYGNKSLCDFLNKKICGGIVEIDMHGFNHSWINNMAEFESKDKVALEEKISEGISILETAFPQALITTFTPPFDALSKVAFDLFLEKKMNISIANFACMNYFSFQLRFSILKEAFFGGQQTIVRELNNSRFFLHLKRKPLSILRLKVHADRFAVLNDEFISRDGSNRVVVLSNHYWEFFDKKMQQETEALKRWDDIVERVLLKPGDNTIFTTFDRYPGTCNCKAF